MSSSLPSLCLTPLIATQSHPPSLDGLPHRQGGVDLGNRKSMRNVCENLRENLRENLGENLGENLRENLGEHLVKTW